MARVKDVWLLRGLPGSGKSELAQKILNTTGYAVKTICSADYYFIDLHGNYEYDKWLIGEAHAYCEECFSRAIRNEVECIIVDNTHIRRVGFKFYKDLARRNGYKFFEITCGTLDTKAASARNSHSIPIDVLEDMARRFER